MAISFPAAMTSSLVYSNEPASPIVLRGSSVASPQSMSLTGFSVNRNNFTLLMVVKDLVLSNHLPQTGFPAGLARMYCDLGCGSAGTFSTGLEVLQSFDGSTNHPVGMMASGDWSLKGIVSNNVVQFIQDDLMSNTASPLPSGTLTNAILNSYGGTTPQYSDAKYAAVYLFNKALNQRELQAARKCINDAFSLPIRHDKNLVLDCDSLTNGHGCTVPWGDLITGYNVYNWGMNAQTVQTATTNFPNYQAKCYDPCKSLNVAFIWGGVNDMLQGASAATTYTRLKAYWAQARAAGFKVCAATLPLFQGITPGPLNALIASDATLYDYLADLAADSRFATIDPTYQSTDGHLKDAGAVVVASLVQAAIP